MTDSEKVSDSDGIVSDHPVVSDVRDRVDDHDR